MKTFKLNARGSSSAKTLLTEIASLSSGGMGQTLDAVRRDVRILNVIEPLSDGDTVSLEDADWERLVGKINSFPFRKADRDQMAICDDVIEATKET